MVTNLFYCCVIFYFSVLVDCVTPRIVQVMRSIIALCFIGIAFSLVSFFLDLTGPSSHSLKILRRNAVFNILTGIKLPYEFVIRNCLFNYGLQCVVGQGQIILWSKAL